MSTPPAPATNFPARAPTFSIRPGEPFPLGATWDGRGTNFAVFSEVAEAVDLCLFDDAGGETCVRLPERTAFCWHGYLPGVRPGQRYGFRVHGPAATPLRIEFAKSNEGLSLVFSAQAAF